jgi:hypothetical protein
LNLWKVGTQPYFPWQKRYFSTAFPAGEAECLRIYKFECFIFIERQNSSCSRIDMQVINRSPDSLKGSQRKRRTEKPTAPDPTFSRPLKQKNILLTDYSHCDYIAGPPSVSLARRKEYECGVPTNLLAGDQIYARFLKFALIEPDSH